MPRLLPAGTVPEVDSTNYEKFRSANPVVLRLIDHFYASVRSLVESLGPDSVLDAGCGEGETVARLADSMPREIAGVDVREDCVAFSGKRFPWMDVSQQSVCDL